ncbi:hypothetical protein, partial [Streptomyces misionensis]
AYLSPDPLGLEAGPNPYWYGPHPLTWTEARVAPVVAAAQPPAASADTVARVKARRDMGPIRTFPYARDPHDHGSSSWR